MTKVHPFIVRTDDGSHKYFWGDQCDHTFIWQLAPSGILIVSKRARNSTFKVDLDDEPLKVYAPGSWLCVEVVHDEDD